MLVRIDTRQTTPLFEQIASQLRGAIARGELAAGERLAAARELADGLGVNLHTVLRAYNELRDEGLVDVRRGRGVIVTSGAPVAAEVGSIARSLVAAGRRVGMTDAAIQLLVKGHLR